MNTTWAMRSLFTGGWIAVDAGQAVDALEVGIEVRLMSFDELLGYTAGGAG